MPSSLAWPDGPASSSSSESVSSPESCSSPSLCHSLSLFPTLGFGGDSRRFLHLSLSTTFSASQQPSLHPTAVFLRRSAASAWMAPPRSLSGRAEDRVRRAIEAIVSSPSSVAMPFPFLSFGFISIE
ncbi:unnamed protein product [Microthlaspi erraticum]|uniref:Uncharacterized protein n=1 Tax=Microthlaspi erraticum TaxID=1685480 RepID=A0A6D2IPC4_9BRAS|nr:unnamed protein product [Microthlaspi erraticum]